MPFELLSPVCGRRQGEGLLNIHTWQQTQWQFLMHAYAQNRLSHAYLLSGDDAEKLVFAKEFSDFLLCEDPNKKNSACKKCRSCRWMQADSHPDFITVLPAEKNHSIKIDDIRLLTQKTNQTSHCGGMQVVLIAPAEAMPVAASNALLKTLEEPTGHVVLLLVSDQMHSIPATILSRCQKVLFSNPDAAINSEHIILRDLLINNLQKISYDNIFQKQDMNIILNILLTIFLDISKIQLSADHNLLTYKDCKIILENIAKKISAENLHHIINLVLEKKAFIANGAPLNSQLLLDAIFVRFARSLLTDSAKCV